MLLAPSTCLAYQYIEDNVVRRTQNIKAGLGFIADTYTEQQQRQLDRRANAVPGVVVASRTE